MDTAQIENILLNDSLFGILDKNIIQTIIDGSLKKSVSPGEMLYNPCEECHSFIFVLSGLLSITKVLSTGKEVSIGLIEKNILFGEACVFLKERFPAWIRAVENSVVLEIPKNIIFDNFSNKLFINEFLVDWSRKIFRLQKKIEIVSFKTIKQKIVYYLLAMAEKQNNININVEISKTQIARELGCSREALSRTFRLLENDGLIDIKSKNKMRIHSFEKFEDILYG